MTASHLGAKRPHSPDPKPILVKTKLNTRIAQLNQEIKLCALVKMMSLAIDWGIDLGLRLGMLISTEQVMLSAFSVVNLCCSRTIKYIDSRISIDDSSPLNRIP